MSFLSMQLNLTKAVTFHIFGANPLGKRCTTGVRTKFKLEFSRDSSHSQGGFHTNPGIW